MHGDERKTGERTSGTTQGLIAHNDKHSRNHERFGTTHVIDVFSWHWVEVVSPKLGNVLSDFSAKREA